MRWDDVRIFLAVVDGGSFTVAARTLRLDQSTVSRRVAALERELGVTLFRRGRRDAELLEHAADLLVQARALEAAALALGRSAARLSDDDGTRGLVRVAAPEELGTRLLAPALPALMARRPGLHVELVLGRELVELGRVADLAIRATRTTSATLVARKVATVAYGVFRGAGHQDDERQERWLALDEDAAAWPEARWLARRLGTRRPVLRASSLSALAEATAAGLGLAVLPRALARGPRFVAVARFPDPLVVRPLWLVLERRRRQEPRLRSVADWLVATLATLA